MTFVHKEEPPRPPCRCDQPSRYAEAPDGLVDPAYGSGTVWQCDNCRKHWVLIYRGLGIYTWEPVTWWRFEARRRIKEQNK